MFYSLYQACGNNLLIVSIWGNLRWKNDKNFRRILSKVGNGKKIDSILVLKGNPWNFSKQGYHCFMDVFEPRADSISIMCGNGIRAVCQYWIDNGFIPKDGSFLINTGSGVREVNVLGDSLFRTNMGTLSLDQGDLRKYVKSYSINIPERFGIRETIIGMTGNRMNGKMDGEPHLICFLNKKNVSLRQLRKCVTDLGQMLTKNKKIFPLEMNISVASQNSDGSLSLCTYERGVYYVTQSCGTATSVAAGYLLNETQQKEINVNTLGGRLAVERDTNGVIYLTGDARL